MLCGVNTDYKAILAALGLTVENVPRFRDAYLTELHGEKVIAVYTRMGGGNRGHWEYTDPDSEEGENCECPGCLATSVLAGHPLYISDVDDDFDYTFATYFFKIPEDSDTQDMDTIKYTPQDKMILTLDALAKSTSDDN